jgi:hypothetical protein
VSQNTEVKSDEQFRNPEKGTENAREKTTINENAENVTDDTQSAENKEYADVTAEFENEQSENDEEVNADRKVETSETSKNSENSKESTLERNGHEKNADILGSSELNPKTPDFASANPDIPEMPAPKRGRR